MLGSCSQISPYFVLALSFTPVLCLWGIYFLRKKIQAKWLRIGALTLVSPILLFLLLLLNNTVCPTTLEDASMSGEAALTFLMLVGFVFSYAVSVIAILIVRESRVEKIKAGILRNKMKIASIVCILIFSIPIFIAGRHLINWIKPSARLERAAITAEENGDCAQAIEIHKQIIQEHQEYAPMAYAHWARILVSCPDKGQRNPTEAKRLIELAAEAGSIDGEFLDIAACVFAAAGDFERALKVAKENNFTNRSKSFSKGKTCFE